MTLKELRQRMSKIASDMKALCDKAEAEDRGLTADEETAWNAMREEHEGLEVRAKQAEINEAFGTQAASAGNIPDGETRALPGRGDADDDGDGDGDDEAAAKIEAKAYDQAFRLHTRFGMAVLDEDMRKIMRSHRMTGDQAKELRALSAGVTTEGGFTVPEGFAGFITETKKIFGGLQASEGETWGMQVIRTASGNDLPYPTNDDTGNLGAILAENVADTEQDLVFGSVTIQAFKYTSKIVRVSMELLQDEAVGLEGYLGRKLAERIGRIYSQHQAVGTGSSQPNGIVTAAGKNAAAAANNAVTHDDLMDVEHAVDPAYRAGGLGAFVFNDSTLKSIKKLKDSQGIPLWQPSIGTTVPASIDGFPYVIEQSMQSIATVTKSVIFGDLTQYVWREVLDFMLLRLVERYAEFGQVGFIMFSRADGDLVDTDAIATLTHPV